MIINIKLHCHFDPEICKYLDMSIFITQKIMQFKNAPKSSSPSKEPSRAELFLLISNINFWNIQKNTYLVVLWDKGSKNCLILYT